MDYYTVKNANMQAEKGEKRAEVQRVKLNRRNLNQHKPEGRKVDKMLTLKKVKEMVKAPAHTKRVSSPKVLLEEGRIFLRKEFEHGSHLTLYHNGYVWFSAGKRNTVFHIHDCRGDYAYGASKGKGEVIKEEYFENCEWHIRALFEGEQRVEESQLKCEGVGQTKVSVSYHAVAEDWGEMADSEINVLDKYIEKEALHAMMAVLTKKQRNLIYQNYVLDKTHQEIADGMGIARGSVTRSVNQALERIRRKSYVPYVITFTISTVVDHVHFLWDNIHSSHLMVLRKQGRNRQTNITP